MSTCKPMLDPTADPAPELGGSAVGLQTGYPVRCVLLSSIRVDDRVQARVRMLPALVDEYAREMQDGDAFPPLVVFAEGESLLLAGGFYRYRAAEQAGRESFRCEVRPGGLREAILYAVGANSTHGLPRSVDDKRNAVLNLLSDKEWKQWSDREIAGHCHVGHQLVGKLRVSVTGLATSEVSNRKYRDKHGTVASMSTANIGRTKSKPPTLAQPECPDGTERLEIIASAPAVVHTEKDPRQEIDVVDAKTGCGARQVDPDEALALQEFAAFIIPRIKPQGTTIVITIAEEDVDELNLLLDRAKSAIGRIIWPAVVLHP